MGKKKELKAIVAQMDQLKVVIREMELHLSSTEKGLEKIRGEVEQYKMNIPKYESLATDGRLPPKLYREYSAMVGSGNVKIREFNLKSASS
ncbi:MAG: hypothetical protein AB1422_17540 [bacterium]